MLITGKIPLLTSITNQDPFEKGQNDLFVVEAKDVGIPKKIRYEDYMNGERLIKLSTLCFLELVTIIIQ